MYFLIFLRFQIRWFQDKYNTLSKIDQNVFGANILSKIFTLKKYLNYKFLYVYMLLTKFFNKIHFRKF